MTDAAANLARWREAERAVAFGTPVEEYRARETTRREAMPALLAFAEAVLAEHQPLNDLGSPPCSTCVSDLDGEAGFVPWPCPTVRLAEQHLGTAGDAAQACEVASSRPQSASGIRNDTDVVPAAQDPNMASETGMDLTDAEFDAFLDAARGRDRRGAPR